MCYRAFALWFCTTLAVLAAEAPAENLQQLALAESLVPLRPGSPGKAPFWNTHARQFIWAPAFDFPSVPGAALYCFTVSSPGGSACSFAAREPWAALTPIWTNVPVGPASLRVEALDTQGKLISLAGTRQFHRAATFPGRSAPVLPHARSARVALEGVIAEPFVRSWKTNGEPAREYPLYRYASKLIGAVMTASALYASQSPPPPDAADALAAGRRAADFLLSISCPAGGPLAYFPPTYRGAVPGERENDHWTMLMSPAEAGQGYLNLFEVTRDEEYLEAARRIAATYAKLQLPSGTWPLKVDNRTGKPIAGNLLIPSVVLSFLDRLAEQYHLAVARTMRDRAVKWMLGNPVRTFDWSAQFDDARLRQPYENLSKHEACEFAAYLFVHRREAVGYVALGEELLRFAEDQFVVWEKPPELQTRSPNLKPENWFVPCSTEQYAMLEPISGSSAFMIIAYVRAWEATGKRLYLAKAEALADGLTVAQQHHQGRYPTRMVKEDLVYWLNSSVNTIRAMNLLALTRGSGFH